MTSAVFVSIWKGRKPGREERRGFEPSVWVEEGSVLRQGERGTGGGRLAGTETLYD